MRHRRGISLIELLVAVALLTVVTVTSGGLMLKLFKTNQKESDDQIARLLAVRSLSDLRKEIYNSALINPREGLQTDSDGLYLGIASFNASIKPAPPCRYEADGPDREKFSIVRYSTLLNHFEPEKTSRSWKDSDTARIRLGFRPASNTATHVFENAQKNVPEVIVIDADLTYARRYLVESVQKMETQTTPFRFRFFSPPATKFFYTEPKLVIPKTWNGLSQPPLKLPFITNSLIYAVATRIVCVNPEGKLISRDELSGKTRVILAPDRSFEITRFEIRYFNSKSTARLDKSLFYPFPITTSLTDIDRRRCLDSVTMLLSIKNKLHPNSPELQFDDTILLNNFHAQRPPSCN